LMQPFNWLGMPRVLLNLPITDMEDQNVKRLNVE
jgi:hypothetical protein